MSPCPSSSLEARVARLEDFEAIRDLTARYAFHVNQGGRGKKVNAEAMPGIFAEDVRWDSMDMKVSVVGLPALIESLAQETRSVDFAMHSYTNPIPISGAVPFCSFGMRFGGTLWKR